MNIAIDILKTDLKKMNDLINQIEASIDEYHLKIDNLRESIKRPKERKQSIQEALDLLENNIPSV